MRKFEFQTGSYYHVYNRGVDKREVFMEEQDYFRFLRSMREFNQTDPIGSFYQKYYRQKTKASGVRHPNPEDIISAVELSRYGEYSRMEVDGCRTQQRLVDIVCYVLNPNHFHVLLKQLIEGGISEFMKKLGGGYTNYFNRKNNRTGSLFGGTYRAASIRTDEQLVYTSGYINGNHEIHKLGKAENWVYSSYLDYLGKRGGQLSKRKIILDQFNGPDTYRVFVESVIKNAQAIKEEIKRCFID